MTWPLLLVFAALSQFGFSEEIGAATDFLRVRKVGETSQLQSAVTTYQRDGISVTLIGTVHLADEVFFKDLTSRFKKFDRLLFEMIGGETLANSENDAADAGNAIDRSYAEVAAFLNLTEQKSAIDYSAKNFLHADLTVLEFQKLQRERGESLLSFARKATGKEDLNNEPGTDALRRALISGDVHRSKLLLMKTLAEGDETMGAFTGQSVIISDRNDKCLETLDAEIAKGHIHLGIFYGAAHFPGMEKNLVARGFLKTSQEWLAAWSVKN